LCFPIFRINNMIATVYAVLFILAVLAITYPKEFPTLIRNPQELMDVVALESRRRWMMLKLGIPLWISKKRLQFAMWRMRDIIAEEKRKQAEAEEAQ